MSEKFWQPLVEAAFPLKIQSVLLTLDDGTVLTYSGEPQVLPGTSRRVVNVVFTEPKDLPPGYHMEKVNLT